MNTQNRSDKLLPGDDQVAEEVSTDQQSAATRRIGQLPQQPVGGQSVEQAVADAAGASRAQASETPGDHAGGKQKPRTAPP